MCVLLLFMCLSIVVCFFVFFVSSVVPSFAAKFFYLQFVSLPSFCFIALLGFMLFFVHDGELSFFQTRKMVKGIWVSIQQAH